MTWETRLPTSSGLILARVISPSILRAPLDRIRVIRRQGRGRVCGTPVTVSRTATRRALLRLRAGPRTMTECVAGTSITFRLVTSSGSFA